MTSERIIELLEKVSQVSTENLEQAIRLKVDTENHPWHAAENLKKVKQLDQERIVLKKISKKLCELLAVNTINGMMDEGSE